MNDDNFGAGLSDPFQCMSKYYHEAYTIGEKRSDIAFYLDQADTISGAVLEIGCGTGRILLEVAKSHDVVGVDVSQGMLSSLHQRIRAEHLEQRKEISLVNGDMRSVQIGKEFDLVICPFRSLQHLYTATDQLAAFRNLSAHLSTNGRLVFDVFNPDWAMLIDGVGVTDLDLEWVTKSNRNRIQRFFRKNAVSLTRQLIEGEFQYKVYSGDTILNEESHSFRMSYYTLHQLTLLLEGAGLSVTEVWGDFDKTPFSESSPEIIVVASKLHMER